MPEVSWSTELGLDLEALEMERPNDFRQRQLATLHRERAEAFWSYERFRNNDQTFAGEIIAWELYFKLTRTVCDLTMSPLPIGIILREAKRKQTIEEAVLKNTCTRCGFIWRTRQPKFVGGVCSSCLAFQEKILRRGRLRCQPWQGRFAPDEVTPVNAAGSPILPGFRICGNSDCVSPKHIRKGRKQNG